MFTPGEIDRFRDETKGASQVIHFNNAGSALPPDVVREAVIGYLEEEMVCGGYETHAKYLEELEGVYDSLAQLIRAEREEIAVLENATVAWNAAFQSIDWREGDVVLTSQAAYASNYLAYLHLQKRIPIEIRQVPNDSYGQVGTAALDQMIDERVKLVSMVHMPTNGGLVNPAEAIGEITKKHGVLYLLDACQSAGQYPLDVQKIGCDMLSATGRKYMRGPRGTGLLYVNKKVLDRLNPTWVDLHAAEWTGTNEYQVRGDARKFENWESNYAGILGLKKAADYALGIGVDRIWERVLYLGEMLRKKLEAIKGVQVHDQGKIKGGIVTFAVEGRPAAFVQKYLKSRQINVSFTGVPNALLDMKARGLSELIRASVHYYNTEEEIDKLCEVLRSMS